MPTRLLRDWTDSDRFDGLSAEAERLFVRLLMKADDYGRFHAEARRVRAACFPLANGSACRRIEAAIAELAERGLVIRYEVDGKALLAIPRFGQRLKQSHPKFPPMDGQSDNWLPEDCRRFRELPGTSGNIRADSESDSDSETDSETHAESDARVGVASSLMDMTAAIRAARPEYKCMAAVSIANALRPAFGMAGLASAVAAWCADQSSAVQALGNPLASVRKMVARVVESAGPASNRKPEIDLSQQKIALDRCKDGRGAWRIITSVADVDDRKRLADYCDANGIRYERPKA